MPDYPEPDVDVDALSPTEFATRLDAGESLRVLDVRNRDEFEAWQLSGPTVTSTHLPYMKWLQAEVQGTVDELAAEVAGDGPITVVCGRGEASAHVTGLLVEAGVEARNLADGMDGWARVYQFETVETAGQTTVFQYRRPSSGCLGYMLVADDEAVVVDPLLAFTERYVADAADRGVEMTHVLDTHVHADHVSGLRDLADETGATPVMPRLAVERGVAYDVETVLDVETLVVGDATVDVIHLPGHTTGMTAFAVDDLLLAGDSLFVESVARPDLERSADGAESLAIHLYQSLTDRLEPFPDETVVAPGHYSEAADRAADGTYTARLGDLRERLPAFSMDRAEFVARILRDMPPRPANFERIIATNLGHEPIDDEETLALELGPNNCAASPLSD
jgi:glyoxylase-like metal-dependent hydrolase (beta-lactamase superfamily II)/rhodanese-related sulfurtransferase